MADAQLEPTAEGEWQKIVGLAGDDDLEKFQIGTAYNTIVDRKLAQAAGYRRAEDFFDARLAEAQRAGPTAAGLKLRALSRATLSSYGAVARAFDAASFSEHGYSLLLLLLRYRKLARLDPAIPPSQVRIRVPRDGVLVERDFAHCSAGELRAALRHLRGADETLSDADEQTIETLNVALDAALGADYPSDVRARVRDGQVTVTLENLPLAQLRVVLRTLLETLPQP